MDYKLPIYFLEIIMNLIKLQNEQLLKIICRDECLDYDILKHLVPSSYELKKSLTNK